MFFLSDAAATDAGDTDTKGGGVVVEAEADCGFALCVGADLGVPVECFAEVGAEGGQFFFFVELGGEDPCASKAIIGITCRAIRFSDTEVNALVVGCIVFVVRAVVEGLCRAEHADEKALWIDAFVSEGFFDILCAFLGKGLVGVWIVCLLGVGMSSDAKLDLGIIAHGVRDILEGVLVLGEDGRALCGELDTVVDVDVLLSDHGATATARTATTCTEIGDGLSSDGNDICAWCDIFCGGFAILFGLFLFGSGILGGWAHDSDGGGLLGAFLSNGGSIVLIVGLWVGGLHLGGFGNGRRCGLGSHHGRGSHGHDGACRASCGLGLIEASSEKVSSVFGLGHRLCVDRERRERALGGEEGGVFDMLPCEGAPSVGGHHKVEGVGCFFLFGIEVKVGFVDLAGKLGGEEALGEELGFVVIGKVEDGVIDDRCAEDGVGDGLSVGVGDAQGGGGGGA